MEAILQTENLEQKGLTGPSSAATILRKFFFLEGGSLRITTAQPQNHSEMKF